MKIATFEKPDRLHFFLIITSLLVAMLVLCSSCSSPDIPLPIEDDITDNRLYTLSFYSNGEIITEKSVSVGTIVGDVKIPNIDTEKYDVKWYIDSSFTGSPINLNQYVLPSQPPTTFYAQLVAKYYDIIINRNNGEDPILKRVYASFFNEETPVFLNYEVVPGRFITLVFDGWYIDGNKIVSNNYYHTLIGSIINLVGFC